MTTDTTFNFPPEGFEFIKGNGQQRIKVIGVGNSGITAVDFMCSEGIPGISFAVCSPYESALRNSPAQEKVLLRSGNDKRYFHSATHDFGLECAEESEKEIRQLFSDATEIVIIVAGLGRNTASGATPEIARMAKEAGKIVYGIISLPFTFEGEKTLHTALDAAHDMLHVTDAHTIINLDNLNGIYKDINFFNCFRKADETFADIVKCIAYLSSGEGYISLDIEDVKSILKDGGVTLAGYGLAEGENRVEKALCNTIQSPLFKHLNTDMPRKMLLKITSSKSAVNPVRTEEVDGIVRYINQINPALSEFRWGMENDEELDERIMITVLATGLDIRTPQ